MTELGEACAATALPTRRGGHSRQVEGLVDAVDQQPRALVRHSHFAGCGRDRASTANALQARRFPGAKSRGRIEDDAELEPSHGSGCLRACLPGCAPSVMSEIYIELQPNRCVGRTWGCKSFSLRTCSRTHSGAH